MTKNFSPILREVKCRIRQKMERSHGVRFVEVKETRAFHTWRPARKELGIIVTVCTFAQVESNRRCSTIIVQSSDSLQNWPADAGSW